MNSIRIVVIGLGPAGLTALKCLRDEGFDVVALERRSEVGGLWSYNPDGSYTSVIRGTVSNISKFVSGFSDFPIPKGKASPLSCPVLFSTPLTVDIEYPPYLSGAQMAEYMQSYARHFNLEPHMRFNTSVQKVKRDTTRNAWRVELVGPAGEEVAFFDKVVFGTGSERLPIWPSMPGRDEFRGIVIHGQSYRSPEQFAGKRVMVVGIGNTACDVALNLTGHASHVYQSYRRGRILVSRYLDSGLPVDSTMAWPTLRLKYLLDDKMSWLSRPLVDRFMRRKMTTDAARQEPTGDGSRKSRRRRRARERLNDWRLMTGPSMAHTHPAVQEDFIAALYAGLVLPVTGFRRFVGAEGVVVDDGSVVEVDAVVFCTGYSNGFGIMPELEMDGAGDVPLKTAQEVESDETACSSAPHIPRLYQMIFPPRYASSVAFLSWMAPQESVWTVCELASTAISQIWAAETGRQLDLVPPDSRPSLLPCRARMEESVDEYHEWWRKQWKREPSMRDGLVRSHDFYRFLHRMAGTAMYDNLDHLFSGVGWKLWWRDRDLYRCLASGPMNSYAWRLFDTNPDRIPGCGRAAWAGARQAVQEAYDTYGGYKAAVLSKKLVRGPASSSTLKPIDSDTYHKTDSGDTWS
ncbi:hypothetical protein XA68_11970 [Ophiocordyceps unilateralis]|uniref:FAD/NAD(P)-binding domain-containing protein n=1 Tax=Ophiocordyceps unilateralis TaxID=268505 RepID=A0A2A9PFP7_OPHUN|nr:hypothetical protein XA68_11970 [Ophiocordyceps unilateralis]